MALTKATYSMISGAVINILDYGASPDATGSTNRVAIQDAIDAAIASTTTRAVYIPRGKFEIDAGIVLASPIYIFGDGFDITNETGSVIETTQTTGVALEFNNAIGSFDDGFILEGFMIVGPSTGSAIGFQVEGAVWPNSIFRNLCAKNMGSHGFYFDDCLSANVENCRAQGNGGNGYRVAESNAVRFRGCTSESNGSHGWEFINDGTSGERVAPSLAQCLSEENAGDAIRINQYTGIMISECYLQVASLSNVDYACIRIDNSNAIRVINNHITSNVAWPLFSGVSLLAVFSAKSLAPTSQAASLTAKTLWKTQPVAETLPLATAATAHKVWQDLQLHLRLGLCTIRKWVAVVIMVKNGMLVINGLRALQALLNLTQHLRV
jgi:hypothetical protein